MSDHRETEAGRQRLSQPLPPGSCDSQVHVFGGPYPLSPTRRYDPPPHSDLDAMLRMHAELGIARGVVVQASAQGWEARYVVDVLKAVPNYRGVILMHDGITDRELRDMHDAGVRGGRLVFLQGYDISTDPKSIERCIARIADLGWFAKIFVTGDKWVELQPTLRKIKIPVAIDHLGFLDPAGGIEQPAARVVLDLLQRDNWWIMLSNGNRISKVSSYDDIVPIARAYVQAAPDRVIWGSDWPHVAHDPAHEAALPTDADVVELLFRYTSSRDDLEKILVANPARLFGFT